MAQSKSTKKFEKNKLKDVLKQRKEGAKVKQKIQMKDKKKARKAKDNERAAPLEGEEPIKLKGRREEANGKAFENMTVDEFFQGGFDIPEKPSKKRKNAAPKETEAPKKRKRTAVGAEATDSPAVEESAEESVSEDALEDDMAAHKEQLEALQHNDPEFYKMLQEDDPELLDFAENAKLTEIDALSADEDEPASKKKKKKKKKKSKKAVEAEPESEIEEDMEVDNKVTKAMVLKWKTAMTEQHSLRSMREAVLAFRAAAHLNEDEGKEYKYSISNPDAYHQLLVVTLTHVPEVLQHHLPIKETASGKIRLATDSKKYRTLTPLLKSHAASVLHLLESLSDASTLRLTLSSLVPLLPYLLSFKKLVRDLARNVVDNWANASNSEAVRISAFLVLRRLVITGDPGIREAVLKTTYQGLVKGSRATTIHTLPGVNLMKNSAAELWGLDQSIGYTTGFTFIRQLAIHLRSSITNNSKESYKTVYNWQYVHSLDFWSRVVSSHCDSLREAESGKPSPLRPLIYPVVQVTLGAMRLIPTTQYFPLRFQLIRSLLRVSLATSTYIPVAPAIYEVLASNEMKKVPKASTLKAVDFSTAIRAPKAYLHTRVYQDGVGEQVVELLSEFFVLWAKSIAFPELALPVIVMLKRWLKEAFNKSTGNKNNKVNSAVKLLVDKLEANSRWIEERRAKVDFAPNDRAGVEGFLKDVEWERSPLGAFLIGQRKTNEERAKTLEAGRREDEKRRKEDREESEEVEEGGFEAASEESDEEMVDAE